jgi:hypothetical protein
MESSKDCYFSTALEKAIKTKFGRIPSVRYLTNLYNLNLPDGLEPITDECFRTCLKGISKPSFAHLEFVIRFFNINPSEVFKNSEDYKTNLSSSHIPVNELLLALNRIIYRSISNSEDIKRYKNYFINLDQDA